MSKKSGFDGQTARFISAILDNLPRYIPRKRMQYWVENPKNMRRVLNVFSDALPEFKVWRTVRTGLYKNAEGARRTFKKAGYDINRITDGILERIDFSSVESDINLVVCSVAELVLGGCSATLNEIYWSAIGLGLLPCPAEAGLSLREQYRDQPTGETLIVITEPVVDFSGCRDVFYVENSGGDLCLYGDCYAPESPWSAHQLCVFMLGR